MNKVLFISPTVYSNPITKDIQKKFQSLSKVCNPTVFAFSEEKFNSVVEGVETIFNKKNKNRFFNYLKIIFLFFFEIPKIVKDQNIEIVCLQDPITGFFTIFSLKIRKLPVKIVVETHGDFINTIGLEKNLLIPKFYTLIFTYLAKYSIKNADLIRSISDFTEKQALNFGYRGLFVRFPAWINIDNYLNADTKRLSSDTFKIIFVGSVTERKNPKIIIESLETIDEDISLEIIGQTPNLKYLKELNKLIAISKHAKSITMKPFIKAEELILKYSSANLFILPSKSEGLGRVIIEAQSTACPVLVSSNTGMTDLIIENETGYIFENNNKNDLTKKIQYIIDNYESALQIGLNSKDFVKENQSVTNFEFGYKKLIDLVST
tara:strand:- start:23525 stop:24658 length:1134 start_codon:yes stop_codon:yes gene_type:complete